MEQSSASILIKHNKAQLERLAYLQEYRQNIDDRYVTPTLSLLIEDTQEALARVSSRLRQLGQAPGQLLEQTDTKLLNQSRARRHLGDQLKFVRQGLSFQLDWYKNQIKHLQDDLETQAVLVALAQQTEFRLNQWDDTLAEYQST